MRRIIAAGLAGGALALSVALAGPAGAAEPASQCNATVADTTPGHVLSHDASTLADAVAKLEAKGADVRVRAMTTAPGGSLDAYEEAQIAACPSWRLDGQIKPNLLVFAVSLDHQDAVWYGKNYARMQGKVDQIRADMGGHFADGHFAAGLATGVNGAYGALWPSGVPGWVWALVIIVVIIVVVCMAAAGGVGSSGSGGRSTYIYAGGGYSGGSSSGGGSGSGGSSGSW